MLREGPIAPIWLTAPLALLGLVVMAWHLLGLQHPRQTATLGPLRARLRSATTLLIMVATPLIVYASSVTAPREARSFVLSWALVALLMAMVGLLAAFDIIAASREHRERVRALRIAAAALAQSAADPARKDGS